MAKVKVTQLDVWIVESNTVYQSVPFNVVTDWVVQGRLLGDDCVRPVGATEWFKVSKVRQLAVYLHQPEAARPEDEAEALEPIAFDLTYTPPRVEEDDDVDMIPLIDVSLVLLIFFMMLLVGSGAALAVQLPKTHHGEAAKDEQGIVVVVDYQKELIRYGVQRASKPLFKNIADVNEIVGEVETLMKNSPNKLNLYINAHEKLPSGEVRDLVVKLMEKPEIRKKVEKLYTGTSDK